MPGDAPTAQEIFAHRIVPVVVLEDAAHANPLGDSLVAGGLPIAEVTFRTDAAAESIRRLTDRGDLLVGAGTVTSPAQVEIAHDAGAQFIVSPGLSEAVVRESQDRGLEVLPGAVTPTEIMAARDLGLTSLKFFPASVYGAIAALKALSAPFPDVTFVPTGGVKDVNLSEYLTLPAVAAVGGSWMLPSDLVAECDVPAVTDRVRQAVTAARTARP